MNEAEYMARQTEAIYKDLERTLADNVMTMREDVFLNFLPLFCGEEPVNPGITMPVYYSYAGSCYREVRVVDANNKFLFNVPPAVLTAPVDVKRERGQDSMANVFETGRLHNERIAGSGDNFIVEGIVSRLSPDKQDFTQLMDYLKRWNEIFTRYGKPTYALAEGAQPAAQAKTIQQEIDDWEPM